MEIKIGVKRGSYYFKIAYTRREWKYLEDAYKKAGLEIKETQQGFGCGLRFKFYRLPRDDRSLFKEVEEEYYKIRQSAPRLTLVDNINATLLSRSESGAIFNVGVFRVIPTETLKGYEITFENIYIEEMYNRILKDIGLIGKLVMAKISLKKYRTEWVFRVEEVEA
jgi:hypothetical protein